MRQIQSQMARLDATIFKLKERDSAIFTKVVSSVQKHDTQRAAIYANELSELRKMSRMATQAKLSLEQVVLRLNTISDLGDLAVTLAPATSIIRGVKEGLGNVFPEVESEMGEISSLLSGILVDAGTVGGVSLNFEAANEEAEKALEEAARVAEERVRDSFPEVPTTVITNEDSSVMGEDSEAEAI